MYVILTFIYFFQMMRLEKKLNCFWSYIAKNKDSELTIEDSKNSTNLFYVRLKRNGSSNGVERWQYGFADYHTNGTVWGSAGGAFILIPSSRTLLDRENVDDDNGNSPGFKYVMKPFFRDYSCNSYTPSLRSTSLSILRCNKIESLVPPNRWRWQNLPIGPSQFADFGYEDVNYVK